MVRTVIITAAGQGVRMNSSMPKQYLQVEDEMILDHTINCFLEFDKNIQLIVVVNQDQALWENSKFLDAIEIVIGGETRFHSVQNAIKHVKGKIVAVHDAVRPLVANHVIEGASV